MEQKNYIVTVVGAPRKDDPDKPKFMRDANIPAGFIFGGDADKRRSFFHLRLTEDANRTVRLKDGRTVNVPNPQMKPFTFNCFERQHPELFGAILREIKAHKEANPTYIKDEGDKTSMSITLINMAIPGNIVDFKLPYAVYRMNRDPKSHKLVKFKARQYAKDGSIVELPVTTTTGQVFLFGRECENPDVYIARAIEAVLKASEKVEIKTTTEDPGNAVQNTSIDEHPEPEQEVIETTDDTVADDTDI